ncbi:hypothetical protein M2272_002527 [Mycobacterium frederiksbergense]|uniref:DUF3263 domain-containing protein n=1 Tax=Mycolicibacterium frederiksbergense TaxID=117567 RepID=A0ABT6L106_9MYCO|nr:hypothetical protein [Mycolicibacterium frederiksbergense]
MLRSIEQMDSFERLILKFVLAWAPYGGPREDDVWIEFGMTTEQLCLRFTRIVNGLLPRFRGLPAEDRCLLERACGYLRHRRESGQRSA